jgi:hypothetical protein
LRLKVPNKVICFLFSPGIAVRIDNDEVREEIGAYNAFDLGHFIVKRHSDRGLCAFVLILGHSSGEHCYQQYGKGENDCNLDEK